MEYLFRFDNPRIHQKQMMEDIFTALEDQHNILVNAPTGIGKTDAALAAALTYGLEKNIDIFFLTPKIAQHRIVADALLGIKKKFNLEFEFVDIVGKQHLCVNENINLLPKELFYSACSKAVKEGKCQFYNAVKESEHLPQELIDNAMLGHNSLFLESAKRGMCAYEE